MSDHDDHTPFGSTVPGPHELPPPPAAAGLPSMPPPPADSEHVGVSEHEEPGSSPVSTLEKPRYQHELGTDWSFGGGSGRKTSVSLPRPRASVALAVVVVLVAVAGAYFFLNRSKSGGGTALALSLTQGQTYAYQVDMTFNGHLDVGGQSAPIATQFGETFSWKVDSVNADGVATVTMTIESLTSVVNGATQPTQGPFTIQIQVAKDGRILTAGNLAVTGSASSGQAFPGTDQFLPLLPDHPVKPGDSWTKTFDQSFPFGKGKIHYTSSNTYLRNENLGGVQAAVIAGTVKVPLDITIDPNEISKDLGLPPDPSQPEGAKLVMSGTMDMTQTAWLDLAKHELLKGNISGTMDMTMQLKGVPAPAEIPDGKIGFSGNLTLRIQATGSSSAGQANTEAADKKAQATLRSALAAAKVYFADHGSYRGISPKMLGKIEPTLAYDKSSTATDGVVSVRDASKNEVLLVTKSASGQVFCVVDSAVSVGYGKQDAKKTSGCTGGW
jgi:hypothetical protein